MANSAKKEPVVLDVVAPFKVGNYRRMVKCGRCYITDKGASLISIESSPTLKGNWDGKSYLVMHPDKRDVTDVFPVVESGNGKRLPALEVKAIFETVEGREERMNYLECGVAFHGATRDDDSIRSLVLTIDRMPIGDTGDWDGFTYTGMPVTPRPAEKAPRKSAGKAPETVAS